MTFVTAIPRALGVAGILALLSLSQCTDSNPKIESAAAPATAAGVTVPEPAPLPPPPKPAIRQARPAPKAATKSTTNGGDHAAGETAEKSEGATTSPTETTPTSEPPAPPSASSNPTEQLALRSPGSRPPIRLIGLNRNATTALLGAPTEERQVAVARVWDYRGPDCRLAVYFYLDTGRNDFYALHYEIDGPEAGPDAEQHCLQQLRDGARGN